MSYSRQTDFPALLRNDGKGQRFVRIPGLDFVVQSLFEAGIIRLWVHRSDPPPPKIRNDTVWLRTDSPHSWAREGTIWLYDRLDDNFKPATPALWRRLLAAPAGEFSSDETTAFLAPEQGFLNGVWTNADVNNVLYVMPPPSVGTQFIFAVVAAGTITIQTKMRLGTGTALKNCSSTAVGSTITLRTIDDEWFATAATGNWVLV